MRVAKRMRGPWRMGIAAILIVVLAVIAYAWIDGGRRPLRAIVEPVRPQAVSDAASR